MRSQIEALGGIEPNPVRKPLPVKREPINYDELFPLKGHRDYRRPRIDNLRPEYATVSPKSKKVIFQKRRIPGTFLGRS